MSSNTEESMEKKVYALAGQLKGKNTIIKQKDTRESKLLNMIVKSKNTELIEEAFMGTSIAIEYIARPSTYTNKSGKENDCWESAYGRYAGSRKNKAPTLTYYLEYTDKSKKFFKPNFKTGMLEFKYPKPTISLRGESYKLVASHIDMPRPVEEEFESESESEDESEDEE